MKSIKASGKSVIAWPLISLVFRGVYLDLYRALVAKNAHKRDAWHLDDMHPLTESATTKTFPCLCSSFTVLSTFSENAKVRFALEALAEHSRGISGITRHYC